MTLTLPTRPGRGRMRRRMRQERNRLVAADMRAAHLAELHHIRELVADAAAIVDTGWVQHGWFAYRDERGHEHVVTAATAYLLGDRPIVGACLVGAVVEAGGGLGQVHSQPVQRTLDLTWHTLFGWPGSRVRWCPAPAERAAHLRDLTRWNDAADRRPSDVTDLLAATGRAAAAEIERVRATVPA